MICKTCGEDMIGDGYTSALHCPNVDAYDLEPDANPKHCAPTIEESSMSDVVDRLLAGTGGGKHWMDLHEEAAHEITRLRNLLNEAADDIQDWGSYASERFQEKHDLAGCVAKYRLVHNV